MIVASVYRVRTVRVRLRLCVQIRSTFYGSYRYVTGSIYMYRNLFKLFVFFCITKFQYRYVIVCSVLQALQVADVISRPVGWQVIFKTVYNVMCITFVVL